MLLPALMTPYAAQSGWRSGFVVLALIVALMTPLVVWLMAQAPHVRSVEHKAVDFDFATIFRDNKFWVLVLCFGLVPAGIGGIQLHLISYLSDAGSDPVTVGQTAALAGLFLIVGRIGTGWLVDRFFAPWIAAAAMGVSALCIAGLSLFGANAGVLGAIAIGLANGAEVDLLGYFTARYFNLKAYGRIYGIFYAIYVGGAGLSVVAYGEI